MSAKTSFAIASIGASLVFARLAEGAYTGLLVTSANSTVTLDPEVGRVNVPVTIYRVWANFTSPNDALLVWGGGGSLGPGVVRNLNSVFTGPGSGFLNHVFGGLLPPNSSTSVSNTDSYFTIGVTKLNQIPAGQGFALSPIPGSPLDVTGTTIDLSAAGGGGVLATAGIGGVPNPITLAGFTGDGDAALRILLMQLTVRQGELVSGTIGIVISSSPGGATTTVQNQFFAPFVVPAPGALAGLAFVAVAGRSRRRA